MTSRQLKSTREDFFLALTENELKMTLVVKAMNCSRDSRCSSSVNMLVLILAQRSRWIQIII